MSRKVYQCPKFYRASWDGDPVRCELKERHEGGHGPLPKAPTITDRKPALAQEHSTTSKQAARKIEPARRNLRERVLRAIKENGVEGLTDEEGIEVLDMPASTYRPRRVELVEANLVMDSHRTRRTRSGRSATVWVAP